MELASTYRNMSVLLTGHTGFKGSWLALWLTELGAQVHGLSLAPPTTPNLFEEARIAGRLASHTIGDIRDEKLLADVMRRAEPKIVFHLAAQPLVRRSYREPRETFDVNVIGTVNVLEAVRRAPSVRVCQVVTSDKCYDNREWVYAYRENDPMGGADPYSASKGCAELVVAAYQRSFFPPDQMDRHKVSLASARAGNVIGGGDWAEDRIIPDCVRSLQQKQPILVRNPQAIRPWQHVLEPLSGYLLLAMRQWNEPATHAEAYNFGPAISGNVTVRHIVEKVIEGWGAGTWNGPEAQAAAAQPHEANFLKLDITKASALLQWRPLYGVDEAVEQTVSWYRRRHEAQADFDAAAATLAQIRSYEERVRQLS
ncbi:MAG TPA: CDP-glucose 4,6-dehydratase [Tepidisphaeraceae bacterium]|jgi:CDP-glucose 4,6-dehydratase